MCIECKNREMLADVQHNVLETTAALVDAMKLLKSLKDDGVVLEAKQQMLYDKLWRFVTEGDARQPAAAEPEPTMIQVIQVDSPDEIAELITRLQGRKPRNPTAH